MLPTFVLDTKLDNLYNFMDTTAEGFIQTLSIGKTPLKLMEREVKEWTLYAILSFDIVLKKHCWEQVSSIE